MKKLSLYNENRAVERYTISVPTPSYIYYDDFSGFITTGGNVRGACCRCLNHHCMFYDEIEISSEVFKQFPKNPTKRVCPTNSISINDDGDAFIDDSSCIKCGLCIHRCPFAAIQFSMEHNKCYINTSRNKDFYKVCNINDQETLISCLKGKNPSINFTNIPINFANKLMKNMIFHSKMTPDISEIMVRNSLINLGWVCNANAAGNNHNRTEYFAELGDIIIFGESGIEAKDTLSITRRILDDMAVLISRNHFRKENIIPLAVINGLPNKRADYYEVVWDVLKILGVQINTLTYHILFLLNVFRIKLGPKDFRSFIIDKDNTSLIPAIKQFIPNIERIDKTIATNNFIASK